MDPASNSLVDINTPMQYENGMVNTSRCYQCCNTGNNCNNFQPVSEYDWAKTHANTT